MIRVILPAHLRKLARVDGEVRSKSRVRSRNAQCSMRSRPVIQCCGNDPRPRDAKRRAFVRFFACGEDLSHESPDTPLPEAIATGAQPFMIVGAIAGG